MSEIVKYLYLDDESEDAVKAIIDGLNDTGKVLVERLAFSSQDTFESLSEKLMSKIKQGISGILMDLCLNGGGDRSLKFTASPIAQHLRSIATSGETAQMPIVLCSTDERLRATYDADKTSHDLYDYKFTKAEIAWEKVATKMVSIANGYKKMSFQPNSLEELLGREDISELDDRIFERFAGTHSILPYEFLNFIIKDIFQHPGILIKESVFAARLGIDIQSCEIAWEKLKEILVPKIQYGGILSNGWTRYWTDRMDLFFREISDGQIMQALTAEERVHILKEKTGISDLRAAKPTRFSSSSYFNTICEALKTPLDSMEGYEVYESYELKPWQEPKFISFEAVASGRYQHIPLKSGELDRFKETQAYFKELRENEK